VVSLPRVDAGNEPLAVPMRRWWTRLSSAHILIFSAGALAFIANLAVLRPAELPPLVAVAAADLLPGTVFDPEVHVDYVPMATDGDVLARFVTEPNVGAVAGHVVDVRIPQGAVVAYEDLLGSSAGDGRRIMSLPIDPERAAGGRLTVGDLIDVIAVDRGAARYVVTGVEVVGLPESRSGSFTASSNYHVVLAVDARAALDLSSAMDTSRIQVVRSTGSPEPSVFEVDGADAS